MNSKIPRIARAIICGCPFIFFRIGPQKDSHYVAQYLFTSLYGLRHDVLAMARQNKTLTCIDQQGREQTINTTTRMKCNDIDMAQQAAMNGLGIACLPRLSVEKHKNTNGLVRLLEQYEISPARDIYAVYPSREHLSAKTRALIDFVKGAAQR